MKTTEQQIADLEADRNDIIASSGRYWQEDEGIQRALTQIDAAIERLKGPRKTFLGRLAAKRLAYDKAKALKS